MRAPDFWTRPPDAPGLPARLLAPRRPHGALALPRRHDQPAAQADA